MRVLPALFSLAALVLLPLLPAWGQDTPEPPAVERLEWLGDAGLRSYSDGDVNGAGQVVITGVDSDIIPLTKGRAYEGDAWFTPTFYENTLVALNRSGLAAGRFVRTTDPPVGGIYRRAPGGGLTQVTSGQGVRYVDATDINTDGTVSGRACVEGDAATTCWPLRWDATGVHVLVGTVENGEAWAVNGLDELLVRTYNVGADRNDLFLIDADDQVTPLPPPPEAYLNTLDLNDFGRIAGDLENRSGTVDEAVYWDGTAYSILPKPAGASSADAEALNNFNDVVGWAFDGSRRAVLWRGGQVYVLDDLVRRSLGDAVRLREAFAISDAEWIVGWGYPEGSGAPQVFRLKLGSTLALDGPPADTLMVAGDTYTIRWRAQGVERVDLYFRDGEAPAVTQIEAGVPADTGRYAFTLPDTLARRMRFIIRDASNAEAVADTSAAFRVKRYHLTRLADDGERYVPFDPRKHGWSFCNCQRHLFPSTWTDLDQFDYTDGTDPFTDDEYDDDFPDPPINAKRTVFPDWPAYTRAFGTAAAYHVIIPGIEAFYRDSFTAAWGGFHGGTSWGGSCSGMALSALLAFGHRAAFGARYPRIGPVEELAAVDTGAPGTMVAVREMANTLYAYWNGQQQRLHRRTIGSRTRTPRQALADLKARLLSEDRRGDAYLYISNVGGSGAHAVVPYRLRRDPANARRTRVYIYDPNSPRLTNKFVVIDSTANTWAYADIGGGWGGPRGMYVMDPITNYLTEARVPLDAAGAHERLPAGGSGLRLAPVQGASVEIVAAEGAGRIGYADSVAFNEIEGARLDLPPVGGFAPPLGYEVPPGAYTLTLAEAPGGLLAATVFDGARVLAYGRADAETSHTDRLAYDPDDRGGTLTLRSDDAGTTKRVTLRAIATDHPERERTLDVRDLPLTGADSVRFAAPDAPDGPRLVLANLGGAKSYTVRLRTASPEDATRFAHAGVALEAGATHTVRPDWATLATATLEIDRDGDGTPEETVPLANEVAAGDDAPEALPAGVTLASVYPNPARASATVRYGLPEAGAVRLTVVDLLGRRVAVLVGGSRPAGWHEAALDAVRLPSGVYVVRLEAGGTVRTRRLTVVR